MKIGVPKEIKNNENRAGLVPGGVKQLVVDGHEVYFQKDVGIGIGISNEDYIRAGGKMLGSLEEVFEVSDMIIKVKEPQPREIALLKPHHILYTYLHLAADRELTQGLMKSGSTCVAYETIQDPDYSLPLLAPMSEVAGRMSTQIGAEYLQANNGGKGVLLGGVPGVRKGKVTIIGCGISGTNAMKMALGLGADVTAIDISSRRLAQIDDMFGGRVKTLYSNAETIETSVVESDLVIGAVLVPGAKAPKLVTRDMISKMEPGSVVVDIAVDQGGCIETCKPTTHQEPTFLIDGITHYCVANMPGAVPLTSTYALTNVTLNYARKIAKHGIMKAAQRHRPLRKGINILEGKLVYQQVADDLELEYTSIDFD